MSRALVRLVSPACAVLRAHATPARLFASSAGAAAPAAAAAASAAPKKAAADKAAAPTAGVEKKASRADKKAAKAAAAATTADADSGDAQWDAFSVPMTVAKEAAIAILDLEHASASRVAPADRLALRMPGAALVFETVAPFDAARGQTLANSRPATRGSGAARRACMRLAFPTAKAGDAHLFVDTAGTHYSVLACAVNAGVPAAERILPPLDAPAAAPVWATAAGHAFNSAFHATHHTGAVGGDVKGNLVEYEAIAAVLERVRNHHATAAGADKKDATAKKSDAKRTIHIHSHSAELCYVMSLPNAFDPASQHPAVKLRALCTELASAPHSIAVRFHWHKVALRFGERKLVHEWLLAARKIARRSFDIAKEVKEIGDLLAQMQAIVKEEEELTRSLQQDIVGKSAAEVAAAALPPSSAASPSPANVPL